MLDHNWLNELFTAAGAAAWGSCAFSDLRLSEDAHTKTAQLCPNPSGILIAAFPYFAGKKHGNLSLYARGEDYHLSVIRRLHTVSDSLSERYPENRFIVGTDSSPLDERQCARLAGLGIMGRHGLVIVPPYGSWVFLGTILTDLPLTSAETPAPDCMGCGACERACPGGALRCHPFDESKCLSALTQKKGALTEEEEQLLKDHPLIWGCDICQSVCPYNREAALSPLNDLTGRGELTYMPSLTLSDLEGLTNRTFKAKYGQRAFAWRGPAVLRRNLALKEDFEG